MVSHPTRSRKRPKKRLRISIIVPLKLPRSLLILSMLFLLATFMVPLSMTHKLPRITLAKYLSALLSNDVALALSAFGISFLSAGLPCKIADFLMPRSDRFRKFSTQPLAKKIGTSFRRDPTWAPEILFILGILVAGATYLYNQKLAGKIFLYSFWFLAIGLLWQLIRLLRTPR